MKTAAVVGALVVLCLATAGAQSNEALDEILATATATYGHAAYLLLSGDGRIDEDSGYEAAVRVLTIERQIGVMIDRSADEPLRLGEFALLVQVYYDLPRGLLGSFMLSPRYAVRDLRFLRVVQGRSYPNMQVSGERMIRIIGRVLEYQEGVL